MISAEHFLAVLEEKDLLPKELLAGIRNRLAQFQGQITAAEVVQLLIAEGYFTPALANHFLSEVEKHLGASAITPNKEEELGFAQLNEERQPRLLRGRLRAYKLGEKEKEQAPKPSTTDASKPSAPSPTPVAKKSLLDKPPASPWSTSVYERETDSYKGLVSYRLAKLTEAEENNPPLTLPGRRDRSLLWICIWIGLALLPFVCLFIWILIR